MFKNTHWRYYLPYAFAAAILYSIPVLIFLQDNTYTKAWLFYLGNALFLFTIVTFLLSFNRRRRQNASTTSMLAASSITTIAGMLIAILTSAILVSVMIPGVFHSGTPENALKGAPANILHDKARGSLFMIFLSATVGNISAGLFVAIIFPFALKGDQAKEKVPPEQAEL